MMHHEAVGLLRTAKMVDPSLFVEAEVMAMAEAIARLEKAEAVLPHHMAEALQWGSYTYLHKVCNGDYSQIGRTAQALNTFSLRAYHVGKEAGLPMFYPFGLYCLWGNGIYRKLLMVGSFEECKARGISEVKANGARFKLYHISEGISDGLGGTRQVPVTVCWPHFTPVKPVDPGWDKHLYRAQRATRYEWASVYLFY